MTDTRCAPKSALSQLGSSCEEIVGRINDLRARALSYRSQLTPIAQSMTICKADLQ